MTQFHDTDAAGTGRRWRRPVPIISRQLQHVGDVEDEDELEAVLATGLYELRLDLNRRAFLLLKAADD